MCTYIYIYKPFFQQTYCKVQIQIINATVLLSSIIISHKPHKQLKVKALYCLHHPLRTITEQLCLHHSLRTIIEQLCLHHSLRTIIEQLCLHHSLKTITKQLNALHNIHKRHMAVLTNRNYIKQKGNSCVYVHSTALEQDQGE